MSYNKLMNTQNKGPGDLPPKQTSESIFRKLEEEVKSGRPLKPDILLLRLFTLEDKVAKGGNRISEENLDFCLRTESLLSEQLEKLDVTADMISAARLVWDAAKGEMRENLQEVRNGILEVLKSAQLPEVHDIFHGDPTLWMPKTPVVSEKEADLGELAPKPIIESKPKELPLAAEKEESLHLVRDMMRNGISEEEVKKIPGWEKLSKGQRRLAIQNFEQILLTTVEGRADQRYSENVRSKKQWWNIPKKWWLSATKKLQLGEEEKKALAEVRGSEQERSIILRGIIEGLAANGPRVEEDPKDGSLKIRYLREALFMDDEHNFDALRDELNDLAGELANIPYEWTLPTASEEQKKSAKEAQYKFNLTLEKFRENIDPSSQMAFDQLTELFTLEGRIRVAQLMHANPDATEALQKIENNKLLKEAVTSTVTERGLYFAYGFVSKTLAASMLGGVGLLLAPVALGGYRSWKMAKQGLVKKAQQIRKGEAKASKEIGVFSKAEDIITGINKKLRDLNEAKTDEIRELREKALRARISFVKRKLEAGLVQFDSQSTIAQYYALMNSIRDAEAKTIIVRATNNKLEDRFNKILGEQFQNTEKEKTSYLRKQFIQGALLSGVFAGAGRAFRDMIDQLPSLRTYEDLSQHVHQREIPKMSQTPEPSPTATPEASPSPTATPEEAVTPPPVEISSSASNIAEPEITAEDLQLESLIEKGESAWKAGKKLIAQGKISQEEFSAAWSNRASQVKLPDGSMAHISEIARTYPGNKLVYILGENGGPGRIDILQGDGLAPAKGS